MTNEAKAKIVTLVARQALKLSREGKSAVQQRIALQAALKTSAAALSWAWGHDPKALLRRLASETELEAAKIEGK